MNRRVAIVGLDIFVLLALPILAGGSVQGPLRPAASVGVVRAAETAYLGQLNRDYEEWRDRPKPQTEDRPESSAEQAALRQAEADRLQMELDRARERLAELEQADARQRESLSKLETAQAERERLAEELAREREERLKAARETEALRERLGALQEEKESLAARSSDLATTVGERTAELARLQAEMDSVQGELDRRLMAETGGHIAGLVEAAREKVRVVTSEMEVQAADAAAPMQLGAMGMVVPVAFENGVVLLAHASALGLTSDLLDREEAAAPVTISRFSAAVRKGSEVPREVKRLRFLRTEPTLVVIETDGGAEPAARALRPSSRHFALDPTVIVVGSGGLHFEGRFRIHKGFVQMTAFRPMEFGARWTSTAERSPGKPGDLVLDHEGRLVTILSTATSGHVLASDPQIGEAVAVDALREVGAPGGEAAGRQLADAAVRLNKWLHPRD